MVKEYEKQLNYFRTLVDNSSFEQFQNKIQAGSVFFYNKNKYVIVGFKTFYCYYASVESVKNGQITALNNCESCEIYSFLYQYLRNQDIVQEDELKTSIVKLRLVDKEIRNLDMKLSADALTFASIAYNAKKSNRFSVLVMLFVGILQCAFILLSMFLIVQGYVMFGIFIGIVVYALSSFFVWSRLYD